MNLDIAFDRIESIEFGVGRDDGPDRTYRFVPVDNSVQTALTEMVDATQSAMATSTTDPARYQPSEKYGSVEYVYLPLDDALCDGLRALHDANNLEVDSGALGAPASLFCYFVRLVDADSKRLTAVRRATQFKGVLNKRLIRFINDSLRLVEDTTFKLDADFDLLIDSEAVHVLRPSSLEFVGRLQDAIMAAAPGNLEAVGRDLPFVDFGSISVYAQKHPRAARYIASIRAQGGTAGINEESLRRLCESTGVALDDLDGQLQVPSGSEMGFLEVLDRRRYEIELITDSPEQYRAASRERLGSSMSGAS